MDKVEKILPEISPTGLILVTGTGLVAVPSTQQTKTTRSTAVQLGGGEALV